uniref:F-box domain-containing protein n=1 Tax=Kalanchoe fedtschenkoi TaxID=63787 RepID=A0A7N0TIQ7_KALFE
MEHRRRLKTAATVSTTTLNDLPEDILRHIISFLPTTLDAVKTTLISQKWRGLWRSLTSLNFNIDTFPTHNSFIDQILRFGSFVTQTLRLRHPSAPLRSFVIRYAYVSHRYAEFVDFWIRYAVSHGASFLDVDLNKENYLAVVAGDLEEEEDGNDCGAVVADEDYDSDGDENHELWYDFDFGVLGSSCVTNLKLRESKLLLPDMTTLDIGLQFGSIRSLLLDKVYMTDQVVSDLMSCCVNLEALELSRIHGIEDVKLRSFTLTELSLKHWDLGKSVEILAPKLSLLVMAAFEAEEYIFTDVSGLVEARITSIYYEDWSKVVRLLTQVQHLVVQNSWFELLLSEKLLSDSFRFPNLKVLQLRTGYSKCEILGLGALLECCPNLETLSLLTLTNWFEEVIIDFSFCYC